VRGFVVGLTGFSLLGLVVAWLNHELLMELATCQSSWGMYPWTFALPFIAVAGALLVLVRVKRATLFRGSIVGVGVGLLLQVPFWADAGLGLCSTV